MAYRLDLYGDQNSVNPTQSITVSIARKSAKQRAVRLAAREQAPVDVIDLDGTDELSRYVGTATPYTMIGGAFFTREV